MARPKKDAGAIEFSKKIGQRIGRVREDRDLTQEALADLLGISRSNVRNWEQGAGEITIEMLSKIAKVLNTSADFLLGLIDDDTPEPNLKALCACTGLSSKAIGVLCDHAKINSFIWSYGEDYETAGGAKDIVDTLNSMLESESGLEFLNALYMIRLRAEQSSAIIKSISSIDIDERYDRITFSRRDLRLALYELSEASRVLAQSVCGADSIERELAKEARKAWETPPLIEQYEYAVDPKEFENGDNDKENE